MGLSERIAEKAKELYKERYGKRPPETLSTKELDQVNHDAAIQVQRELKERQGGVK